MVEQRDIRKERECGEPFVFVVHEQVGSQDQPGSKDMTSIQTRRISPTVPIQAAKSFDDCQDRESTLRMLFVCLFTVEYEV